MADQINISAVLDIGKITLAQSTIDKFQNSLDKLATGPADLVRNIELAQRELGELSVLGDKAQRVFQGIATSFKIENQNLNLIGDLEGQLDRLGKAFGDVKVIASDFLSGLTDAKSAERQVIELANAFGLAEDQARDLRRVFGDVFRQEIFKGARQQASDVKKTVTSLTSQDIKTQRQAILDEIDNFNRSLAEKRKERLVDLESSSAFRGAARQSAEIAKEEQRVKVLKEQLELLNELSRIKRDRGLDELEQSTPFQAEAREKVVTAEQQKQLQIQKEQADILEALNSQRRKRNFEEFEQSDIFRTEKRSQLEAAENAKITKEAQKIGKLQETINSLLVKRLELLKLLGREEGDEEERLKRIVSADPREIARRNLAREGAILTASGSGSGGAEPPDLTGLDVPDDFDPKNLRNTVTATRNFNKELQGLESSRITVENFGKATALAFKRYSAFLVGSFGIFRVVNFFSQATREALEFERQITRIQQVLGTTADAVRPISDEIRDLAINLGVSTTEISQGVFTFAQSGIKDVEDLAILAEQLARVPLSATFDDIDKTTQGLLAVFGQFNLTARDTGETLDLINQFAADFAVESADIFEGVKRGGAAFATAGGQIEEFVSLFSILRESTRESAETLGTFFRTGIGRFLRESSQAELRKLGVTATDTIDQIVQLSDILVGPESAFGPAQRINIAQDLVGQRQFARLLALLREISDPEVQQRIEDTFRSSSGSFLRSTEERLDDVGQSLSRATLALQDLALAFIEDANVKRFTETIADLATSISALGETIVPVLPLLLSLGTIAALPALSKFAQGFGQLLPALNIRSLTRFGAITDLATSFRNAGVAGVGRSLGALNRQNRLLAPTLIGGAGFAAGAAVEQFGPQQPNSLGISGPDVGGAIQNGVLFGLIASSFSGPLGLAVGGITALTGIVSSINQNLREIRLNELRNIQDPFDGINRLVDEELRSGRVPEGGVSPSGGANIGVGVFNAINAIRNRGLANRIENQLAVIDEASRLGERDPEINKELNRFFQSVIDREADSLIASIQSGDAAVSLEEFQSQLRSNVFSSVAELSNLNLGQSVAIVSERIREAQLELPEFEALPLDTDIFVPLSNVLSQGFIELAGELQNVIDRATTDLERFNAVITDPNRLQTIIPSANNRQLFSQFGFDTFVREVIDVNNNIARQLEGFRGENIDALREFFGAGPARGEEDNPQFNFQEAERNLTRFFEVITGGVGEQLTEDETAVQEDRVQELVRNFGDAFAFLAANSGESLIAIAEQLTSLEGSTLDFVESLLGTQEIEDALAAAIRDRIALLNRELELERELSQNLLNLNQQTFTYQQQTLSLQDAISDLIISQQQLRSNATAETTATERAQTLGQRAQRTAFTQPLSQFVSETLAASQGRLDILRRVNEARSGGGVIDSDLARESNQAQIEFLQAQQEVNQRLTELQNRVNLSAQATQAANQALNLFKSSLENAGQAATQFTVEDLGQALETLRTFQAGGLESLGDAQFEQLNQLLSAVGDVNIGGVTGNQLLGDIRQELAVPFLAAVRSTFTGQDLNSAEAEIEQQLIDLQAQQEAAVQQEIALREAQIQLVNLQQQLVAQEQQFFQDQRVLLQDIARGINENTDLQQINQKIQNLFTNLPQKVTFDEVDVVSNEQVERIAEQASRLLNTPQNNPDSRAPQRFSPSVVPDNVPLPDFTPTQPTPITPLPTTPLAPTPNFNVPRTPGIFQPDISPDSTAPSISPTDFLGEFERVFRDNSESNAKAVATAISSESVIGNLSVLTDINSVLNTINQNIVDIRNVFERVGGENQSVSLEVAPIQVNVALSVPDIMRVAGAQIRASIMSEIGRKLSDVFYEDSIASTRINSAFGGF